MPNSISCLRLNSLTSAGWPVFKKRFPGNKISRWRIFSPLLRRKIFFFPKDPAGFPQDVRYFVLYQPLSFQFLSGNSPQYIPACHPIVFSVISSPVFTKGMPEKSFGSKIASLLCRSIFLIHCSLPLCGPFTTQVIPFRITPLDIGI